MRPYVICHMCTTVDGKIIGHRWGKLPGYKHESDLFETTAASFGIGAWLVGTTTMDEFDGRKTKLRRAPKNFRRQDHIGNPNAKRLATGADAKGVLRFQENEVEGDHVVVLVTERVSSDYLAHLQSAGVSYLFCGRRGIDLNTALQKLAKNFKLRKLMLQGGGKFNGAMLIGIDVLGRVIEVVSGENLDRFLARVIFRPLDMKDTGFTVPREKLSRFAAIYTRTNGILKAIDTPDESKFIRPVTYFSGGGGLVSTARDYMRFLMMIQNGGKLDGHRLLRARTVKLMSSNLLPEQAFPIHFGKEKRSGTGFGLGFAVCTEVTEWDPAAHLGEFGWDGAASTHYWISPTDKLIVITLEQIKPYEWDTERGVKKIIYDAIRN